MKAGLWFTAGAAAGVYGMVRARRLAEAFTPDGMRDRVGAAFLGARLFAEEVAQTQADTEQRLRERYRELATPDREHGERRPLDAGGVPTRPELTARTTTTAAPAAPTQEGH